MIQASGVRRRSNKGVIPCFPVHSSTSYRITAAHVNVLYLQISPPSTYLVFCTTHQVHLVGYDHAGGTLHIAVQTQPSRCVHTSHIPAPKPAATHQAHLVGHNHGSGVLHIAEQTQPSRCVRIPTFPLPYPPPLTRSTLLATTMQMAPSTLLYSSTSRIHTPSRSSNVSRRVTSYTMCKGREGKGESTVWRAGPRSVHAVLHFKALSAPLASSPTAYQK